MSPGGGVAANCPGRTKSAAAEPPEGDSAGAARGVERPKRYLSLNASVAELADAQDLGSCGATRAGSTPAVRINLCQ